MYLQSAPAIQQFPDLKKQTPCLHEPGFHAGWQWCKVAESIECALLYSVTEFGSVGLLNSKESLSSLRMGRNSRSLLTGKEIGGQDRRGSCLN